MNWPYVLMMHALLSQFNTDRFYSLEASHTRLCRLLLVNNIVQSWSGALGPEVKNPIEKSHKLHRKKKKETGLPVVR